MPPVSYDGDRRTQRNLADSRDASDHIEESDDRRSFTGSTCVWIVQILPGGTVSPRGLCIPARRKSFFAAQSTGYPSDHIPDCSSCWYLYSECLGF
jgi:hypothetical protein